MKHVIHEEFFCHIRSAETTEAFRYGQVIGMQITKKYINKQEPISLESKQLLIRHKKHTSSTIINHQKNKGIV